MTNWIKTKDQMPADGELVFVVHGFKRETEIGYVNTSIQSQGMWFNVWDDGQLYDVTHWTELVFPGAPAIEVQNEDI